MTGGCATPELLIKDIYRCLDYFDKNPVTLSLSEKDAGTFRH